RPPQAALDHDRRADDRADAALRDAHGPRSRGLLVVVQTRGGAGLEDRRGDAVALDRQTHAERDQTGERARDRDDDPEALLAAEEPARVSADPDPHTRSA